MKNSLKWIKYLVELLFVLELIYVAATLIFLNTAVFHKAVALNPKELSIHFRYGWSIFPGFVHLSQVSILGQDPNVRWQVLLPDVNTSISLIELTQKKLHFKSLVASAVDFKLELKSESEKKIEPKEPEPTSEEIKKWKKEHWKLAFNQIFIKTIQRLQVHNLYFEGSGHITGGFYLWPGLDAEIGPAQLEIKSGVIRSSQERQLAVPVMEQVALKSHIKIRKFHPYEVKGSEVFRYLDFSGLLKAKVSGVSIFNRTFERTPTIQFTRGGGLLNATMTVSNGEIVAPSEFSLDASTLEVSGYNFHVHGNGTLTGNVFYSHQVSQGQIVANLSRFVVIYNKFKNQILNGKDFILKVESDALRLDSLFKNVWLSVDMPRAVIPNLKFVNSILEKGKSKLRLLSGSGTAEMTLHLKAGDISWKNYDAHQGGIKIDLKDVRASLESLHVKGDFKTRLFFDPMDFNSLKQRIPFGEFSMSQVQWNVRGGSEKKEAQNWWLIGQVFTEDVEFSPKVKVLGRMRLKAKDTLPIVEFLKEKEGLSRLKAAAIRTEGIIGEADFKFEPPYWSLNWMHAKGKSREVEGILRSDEFSLGGALKISLGVVSVGTYFHENESEFKLFPSDDWLYQKIQIFRQWD